MFNWIVSDTYQYMKLFNCVQMTEQSWIEWLVLNNNAYNYFTLCKQMINIEQNHKRL